MSDLLMSEAAARRMQRPTKVSRFVCAHRFTFMTGGYGWKLMKVHVERIQSQIFAAMALEAKHFNAHIRSQPSKPTPRAPLYTCAACPLNFYAPRVTRYLNNCHRSPFDTIYHRFAPSSAVFSPLIFRLSQISFSLFRWSPGIVIDCASAGPLQVGCVHACSPRKYGISHVNVAVFFYKQIKNVYDRWKKLKCVFRYYVMDPGECILVAR
jgi:hypothetical protein